MALKIKTQMSRLPPMEEEHEIETQAPSCFSQTGISKLSESITDFSDEIHCLAKSNQASIFYETQIDNQCKSMKKMLLPYSTEATRYHKTIVDIEKNRTGNRIVGQAALKSAFFPLMNKWREITSLVTLIRTNGIESLSKLVDTEFRSIENLIHDVTAGQKRQSVHADELDRVGGNLKGLLGSVGDSIHVYFANIETLKDNKSQLEAIINDIKAYVRVYNDTSSREFPKTGYSHIDLLQFKSNTAILCSSIIDAVRSASCFHENMDRIVVKMDIVSRQFDTVIEVLKIPPSIVKVSSPQKVNRRLVNEPAIVGRSLPIEQVQTPDISKEEGKIRRFIQLFARNLAVSVDNSKDPWEILDDLQAAFIQKTNILSKQCYDSNSELDKARTLIQTQTLKIKDLNETNQILRDDIANLNQSISDMEVQIGNLVKERDHAIIKMKRREDQLFRLRRSTSNEQAAEVSAKIAERMSKTLTPLENKIEGNIVDKMGVFVLDRRCQSCEQFLEERKKIQELLDTDGSVLEGIEDLKQQNEEASKQVEELNQKLEEMQEELIKKNEEKENAIKAIKEQIRFEDIEDIQQGIESLKAIQKEELDQARKIEQQKASSDLGRIFRTFVGDETIDEESQIVDVIINCIREREERIASNEKKIEEQKNLLEDVEQWLNTHSKRTSDDVPIGEAIHMMMTSIDEAPNPLEEVVTSLATELSETKTQSRVSIQRIWGIIGQSKWNDDPRNLVNEIDRMYDEYEHMQNELRNLKSELAQAKDGVEMALVKIGILLDKTDYEVGQDLQFAVVVLNNYVHDLCSPGANTVYVTSNEINRMSAASRKILGLSGVNDPYLYLPMVFDSVVLREKSLIAVKSFKEPLGSLFMEFDFRPESFKVRENSFSLIREKIFQMNGMTGKLIDAQVDEDIGFVVSKFVSLASGMISCFASLCFT